MLAILERLFPTNRAVMRKLYALEDRLEAQQRRFDTLLEEHKTLSGQYHAMKRAKKGVQEAVSDTNGDGEVSQVPPQWTPPPVMGTAHLARRFK